MKEETFDEIVGRALRGKPYVPSGEDDDTPAQPAAPQGVAYDLIDRFLRNNLSSDEDYAEYSKALDLVLGASHGQAPAACAVAGPSVLEDVHALLQEVAACFTRDDDLPDNLLPRIDTVLNARKQGGTQ